MFTNCAGTKAFLEDGALRLRDAGRAGGAGLMDALDEFKNVLRGARRKGSRAVQPKKGQ